MASADVLEFVREDDFVEYFLFPKEINGEQNLEDVSEILDANVASINCCVSQYQREYIWQRDPFNITPGVSKANEEDNLPPHLHGISHYGDNIEDEWFLVYLLVQLTKDIDGLIVRVIDSDGEFLLIEAADYLPAWADPENCEKRVYLYDGKVHMIPKSSSGNKRLKAPNLSQSLNLIRTSPQLTCATEEIQNAIQERIKGYPEKIKQNLHRATVFIPVGVAALLKENPNLISPAVQAFCHRDPIDMRACRAMKYFPPENCVMSSVVFTRCLYAMIAHQKYVPDRRTGWVMPSTSSQDFKAYSLGVKIACGFEILAGQAKPSKTTEKSVVDTSHEKSQGINSKGWLLYLESLKKTGYFKELLEGSKEFNELLDKAQEFFSKNCGSSFTHLPEVSVGHEILALINKLDYDLEEMKKSSQNLPPPDDESWLEITSEDLEKMMEQRYGRREKSSDEAPADLNDMTDTIKRFLDHVSGFEGAEFPSAEGDSSAPERPKRRGKKGKKSGDESEMTKSVNDEMTSSMMDNKLNFDPDSFSCAVQNILDFVIPEDSWDMDSNSDDSDIGMYEDEAEMDLNQLKTDKIQTPQAEYKQYMDQMDRELADSAMGQSFEKKKICKQAGKTKKEGPSSSKDDDTFDDIEDFEPVDIDMNALKNILESYKSQHGYSGPASNLLGPMGLHLETLTSKDERESD